MLYATMTTQFHLPVRAWWAGAGTVVQVQAGDDPPVAATANLAACDLLILREEPWGRWLLTWRDPADQCRISDEGGATWS